MPRNPYPDSKTQQDVATEQIDAYVYCRDNGHLRFRDKARHCEAFVSGKQWDSPSLARLERQRRPALTLNKTLPSYAAIMAEQLNNRADIGFKPLKDGTQETADALSKVFISVANSNKLGWLETQMFSDGAVTSRGFLDVRMDFEKNLAGDVKVRLDNPQNIVLDPDSEEYDPDTWSEVIETKWLSLDEIETMYGRAARKELESRHPTSTLYLGYDYIDSRPGTFGGETTDQRGSRIMTQESYATGSFRVADDDKPYRRLYRILDRQYRRHRMAEFFVDISTGDMRQIPDGMPREKIQLLMREYDVVVVKRRTSDIQWTTTCETLVLHNEKSPYNHFTKIPYFPFFFHGTTVGLVEGMIDPQMLYNKSRSQELHIVNTSANSGWKTKKGNIRNMDIEELEERGAETGLTLELDDINQTDKILPNPVPTGIDRVASLAAQDLKEVSMVSDSLRGFDRADVAAKAIMAKQQQGSTNFSMPLENLNHTRQILSRQILHLVQTFYIEPRLLHITGTLPGDKDETIHINEPTAEGRIARDMTIGEYEVVVSSVPVRETFEESQFQQAVTMRKDLGIAIPDSVIVASSHLSNKHELAQRLAEQEAPQQQSDAEQELARIELEKAQLEAAKLDAERKRIESETAVNLVKAQQAAQQDPNEADRKALIQAQTDRETTLAKLEMEKYRIDNELAAKNRELAVQREKMDRDTTVQLVAANRSRRNNQAQEG